MGNRTHTIVIIGGVIALGLLMWYFNNIVLYILTAAVFATLGRPIVDTLERVPLPKGRRLSNSLSSAITLILLGSAFFGFFSFIIPLITNEAKKLSSIDISSVTEYIDIAGDQISASFPTLSWFDNSSNSILELIRGELTSMIDFSDLSDIIGSVVDTVGSIMIMIFSVSFILFFFLKERDMFNNIILLFIPPEYEEKGVSAISSISNLLKRYIVGIILEVLAILVLDTIGFSIIGLKFEQAVVIALVAAIMNVVPYIGPWIGALFGIFIVIATNIEASFMDVTLPLIIGVTVVVVIIQVLDNILFQPIIYSKSVKAHPLEIFIVILMAGSMLGVAGMILAIPAYTVIRVIANTFLSKSSFVQKMTRSMDKE